MRIISSKRDSAGDLYHYCPLDSSQISDRYCTSCSHLEKVERLEASYRVHCKATLDVVLEEFDVPKAHDSVRSLKGIEVLQSERHSWVEPKLDGVRAIVHVTPGGVVITSRRRNKEGVFSRFQDNVPHLRDHPAFTSLEGYWIFDGEVIMQDTDRTLALTMSVVGSLPDTAVWVQQQHGFAHLHLFDLVKRRGASLASDSQIHRRSVLDQWYQSLQNKNYLDLVPGINATYETKKRELARYLEQGYEGIVLKDPLAGYFDSRAWLKVKQSVSFDALVIGWEPGTIGSKYEDTLGTLRVAVLNEHAQLVEVALVSPGDEETRDRLYCQLRDLNGEEIKELALVVELEGQGWTIDTRIRHPRILRYRIDRSEPNQIDLNEVVRL